MTEPMLNRVADAALAAILERPGIGDELAYVQGFDRKSWQEIREAVGRAALAAMQDVTPAMIEAGHAAEVDLSDDDPTFIRVWKAMLDAALDEEGQP